MSRVPVRAYANPILPGFHPDPSVCRVGQDYYLVNSSFEYFPGVPIHHSRDLVHWEPIGHCLARRSQLPLDRAQSSGGIYAPTIRHHNGTFFMVTTNVSDRGNFIVTATDPAGPWSEPVWIEQGGIDPSLLFDDDGRVYFTSTAPGDNSQGGIFQSEIDIATGKLLTAPREIWKGTGGQYPEGPHLYRINGSYYLMIAEGGTDWGHSETIARSESPWGPFEPCPRNPILTHRGTCLPIQCTGHADLIEAHDGSWWLVFLGTRPTWNWHHLGRETFLAPVRWDDDGWPVIGDDGRVGLEVRARTPSPHPWAAEHVRDDFDQTALAPCWNFRGNPHAEDWSLSARPGWLGLTGSARTLADVSSPAFVGRRQAHFKCRASTLVDFTPAAANEEAGLTVLMNDSHHYDLAMALIDGVRHAILRRRIGTLAATEARLPLPDGPVELSIRADRDFYIFSITAGGRHTVLGRGETRYLSKEVAGGFTGVYFGLYATGNGSHSRATAYFDWFYYQADEASV